VPHDRFQDDQSPPRLLAGRQQTVNRLP
jgi:hypothetical protein